MFDADRAEKLGRAGQAVILVRRETSPEDFHGMVMAKAVLTARGGMTSHAAVVARGMGKPCVAGAQELQVDERAGRLAVNGRHLAEGEWITVDGGSGKVFAGQAALRTPELSGDFLRLMQWADRIRQLRVRVNADTPADAHRGRDFGAEGIGLCRTEHMFFGEERLPWVRKMILAADVAERKAALARLKPMQRADFEGIFAAMNGLPVTIRLLDPPLHEFVPHARDEAEALAREIGMPPEEVWRRSEALREMNPMLGHRGCRLGITYPEIYEMQVEAIFEAALACAGRDLRPVPEVMLPLIGLSEEYRRLHAMVHRIAASILGDKPRVPYLVGTMIEVPRASLVADRIAEEAQFFSFGTNDLTQMTFGYSRDDAGTFLPNYIEQGILRRDPFQSLDQEGVGELVRMGTERGRSRNAQLKVGVCGEHGGDPASVEFFHRSALDYVSCSPYRVPIARLAAAQAAVREA